MTTGHTQSPDRYDLTATVRMLPVRTLPPAPDLTVIVERYLPPVPPVRPRP